MADFQDGDVLGLDVFQGGDGDRVQLVGGEFFLGDVADSDIEAVLVDVVDEGVGQQVAQALAAQARSRIWLAEMSSWVMACGKTRPAGASASSPGCSLRRLASSRRSGSGRASSHRVGEKPGRWATAIWARSNNRRHSCQVVRPRKASLPMNSTRGVPAGSSARSRSGCPRCSWGRPFDFPRHPARSGDCRPPPGAPSPADAAASARAGRDGAGCRPG
jgi:hypothetical protein